MTGYQDCSPSNGCPAIRPIENQMLFLCFLISTCGLLFFLAGLLTILSIYISPQGWRGIVITVRAGGQAGGCQTCGTHISVTWQIFSVRSSVAFSRPVVVHCHCYLAICPIWACPWAKNLSNLPQIGSRLWGMQISETDGWIYPI